MQRNTATMERRYSFNTTSAHLTNPMAESTCINGTPSMTRRSPLFVDLSPKQHSNSMVCLSQTSTSPKQSMQSGNLLHQTAGHTISRQKLNLSHVDPKTFADVHSSGLASRIVKYHESSQRGLQRSMSVNNLYNRPLQLPVANKLRSPLPYKAIVPNVPITHLAPPERSFYCGNTLPSLLRSSSVMGVQHSNEELSRENRPILHPPPHESEPTRSVLDALKEISRKRINTGDTQQQEHHSKKSCHRMGDFPDALERTQMLQQQYYGAPQSSYKRQRELSVAVPLRHATHQQRHQLQLMQVYGNSSYSNTSPQKSPEQLAKRRHCSFNNDIASSLSSSRAQSHKRKLYDLRTRQGNRYNGSDLANDTTASASSSGSSSSPNNARAGRHSPEPKIQRKQTADLHFEHLGKSMSCNTPITPLPETPYNQVLATDAAVPTQRTNSAPIVATSKAQEQAQQQKPKLTLFNATKREVSTEPQPQQQDLDSPDVDSGAYAGIQFIKPKQHNSIGGHKDSSIDRTQKSKLALMLSGLRGEIYQGETLADEPDGSKTLQATSPTTANTTNATKAGPATNAIITTTSITTTTTSTTSTASTAKPIILSVQKILPAATTAASTTATTSNALPTLTFTKPTTTTSSQSEPVVLPKLNFNGPTVDSGLKFNAARVISPAVTSTAATTGQMTATTTKSSGILENNITSMPFGNTAAPTTSATTKPMFSFGITTAPATTTTLAPSGDKGTAATTTTVAPTIGSSSAAKPLEAAGTTTSPITMTTTTMTTATLPVPKATFAFGNPASTAATPGFAGDKIAPSFSFGTAQGTATKPASATASTITSTPSLPTANVFSFGKPTAAATTVTTASNPTTTATAAITFGSGNNNNVVFGSAFKPPTTTAVPVKAKSFLFGSGSTPSFGAAAATTTNANTTSGIFSNAAATTAAGTSNGIFGIATNTTTAAAIFGATTTTATATTAGIFGSPVTTNSTSTFGSESFKPPAEPVKAFHFGAASAKTTTATATTATTTTTATKGNNLFSFGPAATAPAPTSNIFAFGQKPAPEATATTTTGSTPFAFGSAELKDNKTSAPTGFAFGSSGSAGDGATQSGSNLFSFGAAAKNGTPFGGAAARTTTATSAVGAANSSNNNSFSFIATNKPAVMFGQPNPNAKPFAFGGAATEPKQPQPQGQQAKVQQPQAGGFSFSAVAAKAQTNGNSGNLFATATPAAAGATPNFTFGSSASPGPAATPNSAATAAPSFGSFAAAAAAAAAGQNKPFAFGATTNNSSATPAAAPMGGNLFANAMAAAQNQGSAPRAGGFAFGNKTAAPAAAAAAPTNAIGNANTPFAFGSAAAAVTSPVSQSVSNAAKPFSFGAACSAPGPAMGNGVPNIFANAAQQPAAPSAAAFTFGAHGAVPTAAVPGTPQQMGAAGINGNNMFAPPPSTTESRPIRRATRRLQK